MVERLLYIVKIQIINISPFIWTLHSTFGSFHSKGIILQKKTPQQFLIWQGNVISFFTKRTTIRKNVDNPWASIAYVQVPMKQSMLISTMSRLLTSNTFVHKLTIHLLKGHQRCMNTFFPPLILFIEIKLLHCYNLLCINIMNDE